MLLRVGLVAAICVAPVCPLQAQGLLPDEVRYVEHQAVGRKFILYRPGTVRRVPVHSSSFFTVWEAGTAADSRNWGYEPIADREGFIMAYPQGIESRWSY